MLEHSQPPLLAPQGVASGTLIAERYRVEAKLGEGGMGVVYLAEHIHMRKRLAIKILLPEWTSAPEVIARFEREAVAAGAISHPNVAAATDFGRLPDGSFFLVLEYVEGRTLRDELGAGRLDPARTLAIARSIALGVGAAHAKGIVHRDLKPENVMLVTRDGDPDFVKVLDFGIARIEHRSTKTGALTSAGAILGTPHYMAPEQALGKEIDSRADLYALGVMLFEMLTGECPFRGGAVTLLQQHVLTPAPPLPPLVAESAPADLCSLVARLLEKEPSARLASTAEVISVLDRCIAALAPTKPAPLVVAARPAATRARTSTAFEARAARGVDVLLMTWRRAMATLEGAGIGERVLRFGRWLQARAVDGTALALAVAKRRPRAAVAAAIGVGGIGVAAILLLVIALIGKKTSSRVATAPTTNVVSSASPSALLRGPDAPPASNGPLTFIEGAFADHVDRGRPTGDAASIASLQRAIYWVDIANTGRPTEVTLVWTLDGVEVQRQTLRIGHGPHWRTWGSRALKGARTVAVQVLDATGEPLKEDSLRLDG